MEKLFSTVLSQFILFVCIGWSGRHIRHSLTGSPYSGALFPNCPGHGSCLLDEVMTAHSALLFTLSAVELPLLTCQWIVLAMDNQILNCEQLNSIIRSLYHISVRTYNTHRTAVTERLKFKRTIIFFMTNLLEKKHLGVYFWTTDKSAKISVFNTSQL